MERGWLPRRKISSTLSNQFDICDDSADTIAFSVTLMLSPLFWQLQRLRRSSRRDGGSRRSSELLVLQRVPSVLQDTRTGCSESAVRKMGFPCNKSLKKAGLIEIETAFASQWKLWTVVSPLIIAILDGAC